MLTGAGLSTDSGIPDYRGPGSPARMPMTYQEFVSGYDAQQRYWARSHLGWSRMRGASPNAGHVALARLDPSLLITQNVDGLHERAGSRSLVALHGRIADVVCLSCRVVSPRSALQEQMASAQPRLGLAPCRPSPPGPMATSSWRRPPGFVVPRCSCGGVLKPDVVFFGENVPAPRVARCYEAVDALGRSGALLCVGTSLTVMSGFRFVRRAAKAGTPVVIVNRGGTRGDDLATYKVDAGCSEFLTRPHRWLRRAEGPSRNQRWSRDRR